MALESLVAEVTGTASLGNSVHGQVDAPDVVNDQLKGVVIATPDKFAAPLTVAVYVVAALSGLDGVKVRTVPLLSSVTVPEIA
jgi:hypothetical protein